MGRSPLVASLIVGVAVLSTVASAQRPRLLRDQTREARWTADVPARGLRAVLSSEGLEVRPRDGAADAWSLRLRLARWGRGESRIPVGAARCDASSSRLELERGPVTEWYVVEERGIEQGFTIASPPPGARTGAPLRLALVVEGDLEATVRPGGRDVLFSAAGRQPAVHYTGLRAWDATGRELGARFIAVDDGLSILVEDERATYPLTIDPWIWSQLAKLNAGDAAPGDCFGGSASLAGDTALVGSEWDDDGGSAAGSAYVFVGSGTSWSQQAKLTPSDPASNDHFGYSVSLSGLTALVGSPEDDDGGSASGSAYVFVRSGTAWSQQAKLTASDAAANDYFGHAVSVSGDTALIGAHLDDDGGNSSGSCYVFVRTGTSWSQQAKLTANDGAAGDRFGAAVSVHGTTALVGAYADDDWGSASGSAYVFVRSGTSWSPQTKLTPGDAEAGDFFAFSVSCFGDRALVGAYGDDDAGLGAGAAYVFVRDGSAWSQDAKLTAGDGTDGDYFGWSVALGGGAAAVGALHGGDAVGDSGSVYVFGRMGTTWQQQAELTALDAAAGDELGRTVSLLDEMVLAGAPHDGDAGGWSGSTCLFEWHASASASFRNAGTNPASYSAVTMPVLGGTYSAAIDLAGTTGHNFALLVGFLSPLTLPIGNGRTILVNTADPLGEQLSLLPVAGPLATYDIPVPPEPSFAGLEAFTQAVHFGVIQSYALSNAQDLFLGY